MKYQTIVADPPWPYPEGFQGWGKRQPLPYSSMSLEEIGALPVSSWLAREGYLFLWTTSRHLEAAFGILRTWNCTYKQSLVWCKGPAGSGLGGMFATTTEYVLIGQNIRPGTNAHGKRTKGGRVNTSWFTWPRRGHSQKPAEFFALVEQIAPGPYLELFARQARPGWDVWGDEVESDVTIGGNA